MEKMTKKEIFMMYFAAGYLKIFHNSIFKNITIGILKSVTNVSDHKLILRSFEDMTTLERQTYYQYDVYCSTFTGTHEEYAIELMKFINWMLSNGFDVFNAIEQGFAINQKEVV